MLKWDEEYLRLCRKILSEGKEVENRTINNTIKIPSYNFNLDVSKEFPILTIKKLYSRQAFLELLWIYQVGSNDVNWLQDRKVSIWDEWKIDESGYWNAFQKQVNKDGEHEIKEIHKYFGKEYAGTIGEAYGYIVNKYKGVDRVLNLIKNNPEARDNVMSLWYNCHLDKGVMRPCVWAHEVDITNGTLNMYVHQRSCDVPLGLPFNVTQFAALMHLYARVGGYKVGTLSWSIKDAHIYTNQVSMIKELLERGKTLAIYEGYKNKMWMEGQIENYKEEYNKILKTLTKEELLNLKKGVVPEVLKDVDLKLKICDYVLNPPSPELWLNPDVKDFYKFNNDDECKDIKVLNYKDLGKIDIPVTE